MAEKGKIPMYINIAGERIELNADSDRQDEIREAELSVGRLYDQWRKRFPGKSTQQLLAMIAYQYASFYLSLNAERRRSLGIASAIDARLDRILEAGPAV